MSQFAGDGWSWWLEFIIDVLGLVVLFDIYKFVRDLVLNEFLLHDVVNTIFTIFCCFPKYMVVWQIRGLPQSPEFGINIQLPV